MRGTQRVAGLLGMFGARAADAGTSPSDPVFIGAGDSSSCTSADDGDTSDIILANPSATVFTAGDNAYERGTDAEYANCYAPTWGRFKSRTKPVPGNHEYMTSHASGYFNYFGALAGDRDKGYYSYDLGSWHIIALNSNCSSVGGCNAGSAQERWLRADLAAHPTACALAYWHHARFSSGDHGSDAVTDGLYAALYEGGADVVVTGHDHDYERFAPLSPTQTVDDTRGIVSFVVGTGGRELRPFVSNARGSVIRDAATFGVLKFTLHATSADFEFVPVGTATFRDSGTIRCH